MKGIGGNSIVDSSALVTNPFSVFLLFVDHKYDLTGHTPFLEQLMGMSCLD